REISEGLTRVAESFVVAHEYAHVLAGHIGGCQQLTTHSTPVGDLEVMTTRWDEEYEADSLAVSLLAPDLVPHDAPISSIRRGFSMSFRRGGWAGVLCSCVTDALVTAVGREFAGHTLAITDHPPSLERARRITEELAKLQASPVAFDLISALIAWFKHHQGNI